ncbi:chondroitinase-B domain-containing protein [Streptomyces rapamycinicus]|uniref:Uncharacterized protein n=2 Tax=Streptomyces rapamycinicus TaxID=1226757 RepID=A0A0A0N7A5_STRRN|nr:chondroitinase-B domain-containing protein [Streptomyces rapamycinicus]AGP51853.1 hypothetical protein M271_01080 [Streptomyces rapamycinicus NRRL 5491]MBB4779271.1 hypothetical protein [Streptomyces rapamycinicus]RLV76066.1 hypothetical protein D3C57_142610 [Streptomyces rapamycinicus NRRL 5491]
MKSAFGDAQAGDRIVLADGTYSIGKMTGKNGTAAEPITVVAENRGKAVIGDGQLEVAGSSYVTFEGLQFTSTCHRWAPHSKVLTGYLEVVDHWEGAVQRRRSPPAHR